MADNVTLNAGVGGSVAAADDIGSVFYQRVKPNLGADGTAVDAIPVSNGLDTTATGVQAVGVVGHFDDTATGTVTENQFAPVRISSRRALLVEGVASGTAVIVDGSAVTQPISHAALTELAAAIDTELQVDIVGALPAGTNGIGKLTANSGVDIGDVDVTTVGTITPGTAASSLGKAEDAAHTSADVGVYALAVRDDAPAAHSGTDGDYESLHVNAEGGLWVSPTPSASGGLTIFRSLDLDESEEEVKATAGTVYGAWVTNTATTTRWLKFYNLTAANTTVGTSTPVITIGIPGNASDDISGHFAAGGHGIAFSTAISVAATTGVADADTGAPAANDLIVNIFYK